MLCLSKKTGYALIALAFMAENETRVCSAREIAAAYDLPLPRLMNLLKTLHRRGIIRSTRGAKGGYVLRAHLDHVSLYDLITMLESHAKNPHGHMPANENFELLQPGKPCPMHAPMQALQYRLIRFLKDVKLSDVIVAGRRIDVPLERLKMDRPKLVIEALGALVTA